MKKYQMCISPTAPRMILAVVIAILAIAPTAFADAGTPGATSPPAYTVLRYDEDYSYLRETNQPTDLFDPLKFIPLNDSGNSYITLGGQARDRYEFFNHNLFGAGPQDKDGYNLLRLMGNADVHLGPNLRFFVQGISATEQGRVGGPRTLDVDTFDLHQAFADLKLPLSDETSLTLRGGRQNLLFGAQRLVGPLDWGNARRTFDGGRATLSTRDNNLDFFWLRPVEIDKYDFDDDIKHTDFAGIYDAWRLPGFFSNMHAQLETYGLYLRKQGATFPNEGAGREDRYTLGLRFTGQPKPFDFDVDPDYQFGQFNGGDISAYSIASEFGVTQTDLCLSPREFIGMDIASGDHSPGNGHLGTFNQLFPTAHSFFGYIDAIGRQNIIDVHPGLDLLLLKNSAYAQKMTFRAEYHLFWRESDHDAVYNAAGGVLRASGASTATSVGSEVDLLLNWQINRHLSSYIGYSHFFAGKFFEQTGTHQDIDFAYLAVTYTF